MERLINRRITPACAGNSKSIIGNKLGVGDHPRLRGEQATALFVMKMMRGSPPLARGTDADSMTVGKPSGITPACAGNSKRSEKRVETHRDHPRLRGEQYNARWDKYSKWGSPPLALGTDA